MSLLTQQSNLLFWLHTWLLCVLMSLNRLLTFTLSALCLPPRGPVKYSGVEALFDWDRWPFPVLLSFAWGNPATPPSPHTSITNPFLSPWKQTRFKRGSQKIMTLWHMRRRHNGREGVAACRARTQCSNIFVAPLPCTLIHKTMSFEMRNEAEKALFLWLFNWKLTVKDWVHFCE